MLDEGGNACTEVCSQGRKVVYFVGFACLYSCPSIRTHCLLLGDVCGRILGLTCATQGQALRRKRAS
jgi:hypothetical protein